MLVRYLPFHALLLDARGRPCPRSRRAHDSRRADMTDPNRLIEGTMILFVLIAVLAALYFAAMAFRQPRPGVIIAIVVWLAYAVYEYQMINGVLCDGGCNIRIDLLFVWPFVWIASLFGIYAWGQWPTWAKYVGGFLAMYVAFAAASGVYIVLVENPAAERAARAKACAAKGQTGPDCPPAPASAGTAQPK